MKKSMKKFMVACAAVSAITVAAGMSAMAAATYDEATNTASYDLPEAADSTQMTVLVINKAKMGNVADDDILYINQDVKGGTGVDGTAELKAVEGGLDDGTYVALVGYYNADGQFAIKSDNEFVIGDGPTPGTSVKIGDVDQNGRITSKDAGSILTYIASGGKGIDKGTAAYVAAVLCNGLNDTRVTSKDAGEILTCIANNGKHEYVGTTADVDLTKYQ